MGRKRHKRKTHSLDHSPENSPHFEEVVNIHSIHHALTLASKGKYKRPDVMIVVKHDTHYIMKFLKELYDGTYRPMPYEHFTITKPKNRAVIAAPFPDRVIHQLIVEYIFKPYFVPLLSPHTFACLKGRGVHNAIKHFQKRVRSLVKDRDFGYIVKMDISKFFYSIDRDLLLKLVKETLKDERLIQIVDFTIHTDASGEYDMSKIPGMEHEDSSKKGIPIGNVTSQYLANIYMNVLDTYITNTVLPNAGMKSYDYVRYMDDFLIFVRTKEEARDALQKIQDFAWQSLELRLNTKSQIIKVYPDTAVLFCGYLISSKATYISGRNQRSLRPFFKIKSAEEFSERFPSWIGHAGHCCNWWEYSAKFLKRNPVFMEWMGEYGEQRTPALIRSMESSDFTVPPKNIKRRSKPNHKERRREARRLARQLAREEAEKKSPKPKPTAPKKPRKKKAKTPKQLSLL